MENKKFKLTSETKRYGDLVLYRIMAINDFGNVRKGELGGFVEKSENLSVYGDAWVSGDARVYGNAKVSGDAWVSGDAEVYGDAWVYGDAKVCGDARVYGDAEVSGDAWVYGNEAWFLASSVGSENGTLTAYMTKDNTIEVTRGCFRGSLDEFKHRVEKVHEEHNSKVYRQYMLLIQVVESKMEVK